MGFGCALHHRRWQGSVPQLLQDAGRANELRELRCAQRLARSDSGPRRDDPGLVSGWRVADGLDGCRAPARNRVLRSWTDGYGFGGRERWVVVDLLVQRLHVQL